MSKVIRSVTAKFNADISDFQKQMNTMSKNLKKSGEEWKKAGESLTKMVTVPILAAATAMVALSVKAGEYAEQISIAAQTTGMSVERLQELRYVASQVDVEFETLVGSFGKFTKTLATANNKKSAAAQLFKALGVTIKNADGSLRPMNDTFFATIKALSGVSDETLQAETASILFGKSFQDLIPLIKTSSEDIDKLSQRANALNLVRSPAEIASMAALDDKFAELKMVVENAGTSLAVGFLPVMGKLIGIVENNLIPAAQKIINKIVEWIGAFDNLNPQQQNMTLGAIALAAALGPVAVGIGQVMIALSLLMKSGGLAALAGIGPALAVAAAGVAGALAGKSAWESQYGQPLTSATQGQSPFGIGLSIPKNGSTSNPSYIGTASSGAMPDNAARSQRAIAGAVKATTVAVKTTAVAVGSADKALAAYFNSLGQAAPKAAKAVKTAATVVDTFKESIIDLVNTVKDQTKAFLNFVGIFDVMDTKAISGDRLLIRLKKQFQAMLQWKTNLDILTKRGVSAENVNMLRGMGAGSAQEIKGLAGLTDAKLKEYFTTYGKMNTIAGEQSSKFVSTAESIGTKIDKQINIYATGVKGDANAIADSIVKKLRVAGYRI